MIGGVFWSYFQTPSVRQTTYAPVILIGCGISVIYVMSLAFITELIGENKVCDRGNRPNFVNVCFVTYEISSFFEQSDLCCNVYLCCLC